MKKITLLTMALLLGAAGLWARPGYKQPVQVKQPNGTTVTLVMQGDEFQSFMTTIDGYTVIKGDDGYYRYALKQGDELKASAYVARDAGQREADEAAFLAGCQKMVSAAMSEEGRQWKEKVGKMYRATYENHAEGSRRAITPGAISNRINYSQFKGLVLLVNWNDRTFNIDEPVSFYTKLTSEKNYTDNSRSVYPYNVKGSARDYFYANSMGMFDPTFDVVGPITINISCEYPWPKDEQGNIRQGYTQRMNTILKACMEKAQEHVDFSNYDLNNDGFIDMVYLIFAGYGSYVSGNNQKLLWPHADDYSEKVNWYQSYADVYGMTNYNGKKFGRYACSVEIQDYEGDADRHAYADGIGTICHEFSHVLGLADHYDTANGANGTPQTPGGYDIMANGADYNQGLSPVGYNAFERYVLGFADKTVTTLDMPGNYSLEPFNTSNTAYIVKTSKDGEVFYVENRQKQGWDESLPGSGLLIWRADTSNPDRFIRNIVNDTPGEECFLVVGRAPYKSYDLTTVNNSLWAEKEAAIDLYGITETSGVITFEAGKDLYPTLVEDFEATPFSNTDVTGADGKFCSWDFTNAGVQSTECGYGEGLRVVELRQYGMMTSSALSSRLRTLQFTVANGSEAVRFALRTSTNGSDWTILNTIDGRGMVNIAKNQSTTMMYREIPEGSMIQFVMSSTSANARCYLDNLTASLASLTAISTVRSEAAVWGEATYNLAGQRVGNSFRGLVVRNGKKFIIK